MVLINISSRTETLYNIRKCNTGNSNKNESQRIKNQIGRSPRPLPSPSCKHCRGPVPSCKHYRGPVPSCKHYRGLVPSCKYYRGPVPSCKHYRDLVPSCKHYRGLVTSCKHYRGLVPSCKHYRGLVRSCVSHLRLVAPCKKSMRRPPSVCRPLGHGMSQTSSSRGWVLKHAHAYKLRDWILKGH